MWLLPDVPQAGKESASSEDPGLELCGRSRSALMCRSEGALRPIKGWLVEVSLKHLVFMPPDDLQQARCSARAVAGVERTEK